MFTMGGQLLRVAIQTVGIVLLARLLTPSDYGLVAMVVAITGFGEIVRDFGLSHAAIQSRTLSPVQKSNLFWLNVAISVVLAAAAIALSPLIAVFYGEPRLQLLTVALSSSFILNGLSTQHRATLTRDIRLGKLAVVDIVSPATGLAIGIAMALLGFGYWALAGQQIGTALVNFLMLQFMTRWLPSWYRRGGDMRKLVTFGSHVFLSQTLTYASRNVDSLVIGSQFGAAPLGIYNRAFQLLLLPLNQINAPSTRVALPVLSRLQDDAARFKRFILTGQTVMLHLILAMFSFACAVAQPLILIVLGSQWESVAPIFQILTIAGVFQVAGYATYWVYLAKGLTRSLLMWSLTTRPALIVAILVGSLWGVSGVAWAYSIGTALLWPVGLIWIGKISDAPAAGMFFNGIRALTGYAICGSAAFFTTVVVGSNSSLIDVLVGLAAWIVAFVAVFLVWPQFRSDVRQIFKAVALIRKR
jgi:PST family polysaccharide transporter